MYQLNKYLQLYIGCQTNKGQLIGIKNNLLFIESTNGEIIENYEIQTVGISLFLYLRQLSDLTDEESNELIKKGFNIGRPKGYSFSTEAFLFLLTLNVDLFGLIKSGYAKELKSQPDQNPTPGY
ncbi:MAG: hypothetical protein M3O67_03230 [Bacteroidota bacterium]|nr:hypothetical protein [Bacteroidota bacterium]